MKNINCKKLFLAVALILAVALNAAGCGSSGQGAQNESPASVGEKADEAAGSARQPAETNGAQEAQSQDNVLGEGKTVIHFVVEDKDGNETKFEIHTDKETVGDALLEHKLIAGDDSEYGLYVKQVNGITADYDTDQTYWAFYVNGEYASAGVDATPVKEGGTYMFKIEK